MSEAITFIALAIWVVCTEIRIRQLYFRNEFLKERVVDIYARMCVLETRQKRQNECIRGKESAQEQV